MRRVPGRRSRAVARGLYEAFARTHPCLCVRGSWRKWAEGKCFHSFSVGINVF